MAFGLSQLGSCAERKGKKGSVMWSGRDLLVVVTILNAGWQLGLEWSRL